MNIPQEAEIDNLPQVVVGIVLGQGEA